MQFQMLWTGLNEYKSTYERKMDISIAFSSRQRTLKIKRHGILKNSNIYGIHFLNKCRNRYLMKFPMKLEMSMALTRKVQSKK